MNCYCDCNSDSLHCIHTAECRQDAQGHSYVGTVSVTKSGKRCQQWSSNTPHTPHSNYGDDKFPDGSRALARNYCRNPDANDQFVWCYTTDPNTRWERCDVPLCRKSAADCSYQRTMCLLIRQKLLYINIVPHWLSSDQRRPLTWASGALAHGPALRGAPRN